MIYWSKGGVVIHNIQLYNLWPSVVIYGKFEIAIYCHMLPEVMCMCDRPLNHRVMRQKDTDWMADSADRHETAFQFHSVCPDLQWNR